MHKHATTNAQRLELGQVANPVRKAATQLVVVQIPVCMMNRAKHGSATPKATLKLSPAMRHMPHASLAHTAPLRPHCNTCKHAATNAQRLEHSQFANCVGDAVTQLVHAQPPVCRMKRTGHRSATPKATQKAPHPHVNAHCPHPTAHEAAHPHCDTCQHATTNAQDL